MATFDCPLVSGEWSLLVPLTLCAQRNKMQSVKHGVGGLVLQSQPWSFLVHFEEKGHISGSPLPTLAPPILGYGFLLVGPGRES